MKLKHQLTHAIDAPQPGGSAVVLSWKSEPHNLIHFSATNTALNKRISGRLHIQGDNLVVKFDGKSSYSEKYARQKLRADLSKRAIQPAAILFNAPFSLTLPDPAIGDIIATRERIDAIQEGDPDIILASGKRYFAVNDDLIQCNGRALRETFTAHFTEKIVRDCDESTTAIAYNLFLLIA